MTKMFSVPEVAERYDRARVLPNETVDLWTDTLKTHLPSRQIHRILDLGSGTGRFSGALAASFGCPVFALDPSYAMLNECQPVSGVQWAQGCAEAIPLRSDSVDLVWMSQVFHHLDSPERALDEVDRVLANGGMFAVRNGTRESDREVLWLRFFPEAEESAINRLATRERILDTVSAAGFEVTLVRQVDQVFASSYEAYYAKIAQRALSPLISIPDKAFESGLERLRQWAALQPTDVAVHDPVDLFVFRPLG